MSEEILRVLMQLFALASSTTDITKGSRNIIRHSISTELIQARVEKFLAIYDDYLKEFQSIKTSNQGSLLRDEILKTCQSCNSKLTFFQKHIVLIRVLEYIFVDNNISKHESEFVQILSDTFSISPTTKQDAFDYISSVDGDLSDNDKMMVVSNREGLRFSKTKFVSDANFDGYLIILYIKEINLFLFKYIGNSTLFISSRVIIAERTYVFNSGTSLRGAKMTPVYYSDILAEFIAKSTPQKLVFEAKNVTYKFPSGDIGLNEFSIRERSGRIIGLMGGSGSGKSTMLNVLNGSEAPNSGTISINNINIHTQKNQLEGLIGFISQDDLLIEELTVFQNLYYNAKLCFADLEEKDLIKKVDDLLQSLGLHIAKNLKVGNPIDKVISGGQRKRLNIALELIREPSVLFVDEPTSGLSSRDSENIMDLLKELALKGKLVFVVIHQPSSYIFKLFDRLILLDTGGYMIYYGEPVDSISYFKTAAKYVDADDSECVQCGNVNSELIFNIIEQKVVDEYGSRIDRRKTSPQEWSSRFIDLNKSLDKSPENIDTTTLESTLSTPNIFNQFKIYLSRDILAKSTNKQYLLINLLEAPILALFMAYFVRYAAWSRDGQMEYKYFYNENIPAYIFMAIVVALFIGMTVSAEEIFKDRMLRKREQFLNLSYGSYLSSKFVLLFAISAIQTWLFVIIGNTILEISDMTMRYWLVMFSISFFANMVGLNISASFKSAVAIYIIIPFLIIPQLIFSGVMVSFDRLNPTVSSRQVVPFIGEVMASRWGYEALMVTQFKDNPIAKYLYKTDKKLSEINYLKSYWLVEIQSAIHFININRNDENKKSKIDRIGKAIQNELSVKHNGSTFPVYTFTSDLKFENLTPASINDILEYLRDYKKYLNKVFIKSAKDRDKIIYAIEKKNPWGLSFNELKEKYVNETLSKSVKLHNKINKVIFVDEKLVPIGDPIFRDASGIRSHYYAPNKLLFGKTISTFWYNIGVLWLMSISLMATLYFNVFQYLFSLFDKKKKPKS